MANFDYSKCRFITTSKNPLQYYLDMLKKYIGKTCSPDELEDEYKDAVNILKRKLKGESIESPKVLHKICYYVFNNVWIDACQDTTYYPNKSLALELCGKDKYGEYFYRNDGFFTAIQSRVGRLLSDTSIQVLLSSPDRFDNYAVIDFDELSMHINNAIRKYYDAAEKTDPRLLKSALPTKALHTSVENAIKEFDLQLRKVIHNYNPNPSSYDI